jgi:hypothetical protein
LIREQKEHGAEENVWTEEVGIIGARRKLHK